MGEREKRVSDQLEALRAFAKQYVVRPPQRRYRKGVVAVEPDMSKWPQNQEYAQGWKQIAHYLGRSVRGAQDLAHVYGMPAQFVGGEVWIKYEILDKWLGTVPKWRWDDGCKSGLRKATIQCGLLLLAGVLGNLPEDLQEGIKLVAGSKERAKTLQGLAQELAKVVGES